MARLYSTAQATIVWPGILPAFEHLPLEHESGFRQTIFSPKPVDLMMTDSNDDSDFATLICKRTISQLASLWD